mgnify:CR=1 FL=1
MVSAQAGTDEAGGEPLPATDHMALAPAPTPAPTSAPTSAPPVPIPSPSVLVRDAAGDDLVAIHAIELEAFPNPFEQFHKRQLRRLIANPRALVFVAQDGDGIAGWAVGLVRGGGAGGRTGRLYALAVRPDRGGRGVGRLLAQRVLGALAEAGAGAVTLEVRRDNAPAQKLYHALGFEPIGTLPGYYGPGTDGLRMRREPQPAR